MKLIDRLKDRIKYKTKIVTRVENGVPVLIKMQAKRLPRLYRKMRKARKIALYAAVIILSIVTACFVAYVLGGSSAPPAE